jgi:hypothetical protein
LFYVSTGNVKPENIFNRREESKLKNLKISFACLIVSMCFVFSVAAQDVAEIKVYEINKVSGNAPTIDGEWSEEEWAGSTWTGDFYGTRHSFNDASLWGEVVDIGYQWRALWDDEQVYFLITMPMLYINMNGWVWSGDYVGPLEEDDAGYAGWANGQCLNIEFFMSPNWPELYDWGYLNEVAQDPPNYHFGFFPLLADAEGDTEYAPSNFGVRGAEGPPFLFTECDLTGSWDPIYDPAAAEEAGILPFQMAALPHLIDGAVEGEEIVGVPALELAIPYTSLSFPALPGISVIEDNPDDFLVCQAWRKSRRCKSSPGPDGGNW